MQMRKTMEGMDMPIYIVFHNYCVSQPDKGRTYLCEYYVRIWTNKGGQT